MCLLWWWECRRFFHCSSAEAEHSIKHPIVWELQLWQRQPAIQLSASQSITFDVFLRNQLAPRLINQPPGPVLHVDPSNSLPPPITGRNKQLGSYHRPLHLVSFVFIMFEVNIGRECLEIDSRLNSADFRELPLCYFASLPRRRRRRCLYLQHALIQLNHIHKLLKLLRLPRRPHVCTAAAQICIGFISPWLNKKEFILRLRLPSLCVCLRGERSFW